MPHLSLDQVQNCVHDDEGYLYLVAGYGHSTSFSCPGTSSEEPLLGRSASPQTTTWGGPDEEFSLFTKDITKQGWRHRSVQDDEASQGLWRTLTAPSPW